jgi:MtaA/CmuA family methyltransferase
MKEMTSLERCRAVLNRQVPDRVPVVPQAFLFACEQAGYRIGDISRDAAKVARTHVACQEKYGYDGCVIDIDDASIAEACGATVIFRDDEVAIVNEHEPALKDLRAIEDLELPDPRLSGRLPVWLEATRLLVDEVGDRVFVMGRADQGPFNLLCLLRGTENIMTELITEDPEVIDRALAWCTEAVLRFARAQKDAGAHATSIGDAYASPNLISPDLYRRYALEPEKKMAAALKEYGIPFSIHICGNTTAIIGDMASTGADILEVDWQMDMGEAKKHVDGSANLMGNINPSNPLVFGTPRQVEAEVKSVIEKTKGKNLFLSSGCAMGRNTRPENMAAMIEAAKKYGTF